MTSPTLPQIVENLSEAERAHVLRLPDEWATVTPWDHHVGSRLYRHGLMETERGAGRGQILRRLTSLGLQVRTHLLSLGEGM